MIRDEIYKAIDAERERQLQLHGDKPHSDAEYLTIMLEEIGEVAKEAQSYWSVNSHSDYVQQASARYFAVNRLKNELIQVLAVGVQWLEAR